MTTRHISDLLPNVTADLDDQDVVLDALVLLRVVDPTRAEGSRLDIVATPDLDWMLQLGMLQAAMSICERIEPYDSESDE